MKDRRLFLLRKTLAGIGTCLSTAGDRPSSAMVEPQLALQTMHYQKMPTMQDLSILDETSNHALLSIYHPWPFLLHTKHLIHALRLTHSLHVLPFPPQSCSALPYSSLPSSCCLHHHRHLLPLHPMHPPSSRTHPSPRRSKIDRFEQNQIQNLLRLFYNIMS